MKHQEDMSVQKLGPCNHESPLMEHRFTDDADRIPLDVSLRSIIEAVRAGEEPAAFELAGPRSRLFFEPSGVTAGIVTCGGLCPGLNDVIRSITLCLHKVYGASRVLGFRYGYMGLADVQTYRPMELTCDVVDDIHRLGGTILGTSRGKRSVEAMVDNLSGLGVDMLFTIGGDGTHRGAIAVREEIGRRGLPIAVVGVPKTIDNDLHLIDRSFGFDTAVALAGDAVRAASNEARAVSGGIGLVQLMGRLSGFIAAYAAMAYSEVDLCLIPEAPFTIEGVLGYVARRIRDNSHAVVVVAEGAGQELVPAKFAPATEAGHPSLRPIGRYLEHVFKTRLPAMGIEPSVKYVDPSYMLRGLPANASDSVYCAILGQNAVHAAMAGRTGMLVGRRHDEYVHVPMHAAVGRRKRVDTEGVLWKAVLGATGQPQFLA